MCLQIPKDGIPNGYSVIFENHEMMSGRAFRIPGVGDSWNKVAPPVRLLARDDLFLQVRHSVNGHSLHKASVFPPLMGQHLYGAHGLMAPMMDMAMGMPMHGPVPNAWG